MHWDHVESCWPQIAEKVTARWGKLNDDDVRRIAGKRDFLIRTLRTRYGVLADQAERQVDDWVQKLDLPLRLPERAVRKDQPLP